jgi:phosphatidylserine decarboxylase
VALDPDLVYAASDGRVLSVERMFDPRLGTEEWLRIAVFLSLTDVHINRTPIAGKVIQILREPGGYAPAYDAASEHNVAQYTMLEGARGRCVVAQRVGLVARRIVNWSKVGDLLAQGERYGLICLGSRTDVYLPYADVQASVNPGDQVQAGITVIARYR